MSSGARQTITLVPEIDVGVEPAALNGFDMRFTSSDLTRDVVLEESDEISALRLSQGSIAVGVDVGGSIEGELSYGTYDPLFEAAFAGDWTSDVLTSSDKIHTFTAIRAYDDIKEYAVFNGVHVNEMSITLERRAKALVSFGLMGMDYRRVHTADPRGTRTPVTDAPYMSSLDVGKIKVDGAELTGICVSSFSFSINNNAEGMDCLGSGKLGYSRVTFLAQDITGNLTLEWSKGAADIVDKTVLRTAISVELPLTSAAGNKYTLVLPMVEVNGDLPSGGKNDVLEAAVEYTVVKEAVTLTREAA